MHSAPCLVVAALLLSGPAGATEASPDDPTPPVQELIREGIGAFADGDLAHADATWARIRAAYPGHPAAPVYEMRTVQSRRSLDYWGGGHEQAIRTAAEEAETLSRAWVEREPDSAQAHFYLGQTLMERMVLDAMDGNFYRAGTAGENGRKHLERALELDPGLVDARLPLGHYQYYSSIATRFVPFLRWLWFVPSGDREGGLENIKQVAEHGDVLRFNANIALAGIYLWSEETPELALPLIEKLLEEHPDNSYLQFEIVEIRMVLGDHDGTIEAALGLEAGNGTQFGDDTRRDMARLFRARALLYQGRSDSAHATLQPLKADAESHTRWIQRWLTLTQAQLHDAAGEREQAIERYEELTENTGRFGIRRTTRLAREGVKEPFRIETASPSVASGP